MQTQVEQTLAPPTREIGGIREHDLKIWPAHFDAVASGDKKAEVRRYDRQFRVGDFVNLEEVTPHENAPTGRTIRALVTHIIPGGAHGLPLDLCVFSIEVNHAGVW